MENKPRAPGSQNTVKRMYYTFSTNNKNSNNNKNRNNNDNNNRNNNDNHDNHNDNDHETFQNVETPAASTEWLNSQRLELRLGSHYNLGGKIQPKPWLFNWGGCPFRACLWYPRNTLG